MFAINEDLSIHVTRGDIVYFAVTMQSNGEIHNFQPDDIVRIKVFEKKNCDNVVLQKSFLVSEETESVDIVLTKEDTKIGGVISKPVPYWYEIELNPYTHPQTIVGYDEDGAKTFTLYPEGADVPEDVVTPEDIPVVDTEFNETSPRPLANFVITGKFTEVDESISALGTATENAQKTADEAKAIAESAGSGEAQDVSNGFKKSVFVMGCYYEGAVKITDNAPVRHKTYFKPSFGYGGTAYVIPVNFAPKDWDINEKVEITVFPSSNDSIKIGAVSVDADGNLSGGIGKLWELVDANGSVISSGVFDSGLVTTTIQLTTASEKLIIYSAQTKETSVGVTSQMQWTGMTIAPMVDGSVYGAVEGYEPREIIKSTTWISDSDGYKNYIESIDQDAYYVWCNASEHTYYYNADINTVIGSGSGGGDVHKTTEYTISASLWDSATDWYAYKDRFTYVNSIGGILGGYKDSVEPIVFIDIAPTATLEQRQQAEKACLYMVLEDFFCPPVEDTDGIQHCYPQYVFGITADTAPTVDIPLVVTYIPQAEEI